jgi:glycosyltransferase involved in cell wall biosynthesis
VSVEHHLGVDTAWFTPKGDRPSSITSGRSSQQLAVGYCGRFDLDKGVLDLVEGVRQARTRTGENIGLSLLGYGALVSVLERARSEERWIELHPVVSNADVVTFLRSLDIFVLASKALPDHEEHDAHALLEALACGLPCIATDVGVNGDILDADNGILVPRGDIQSLTEAIVRLAGDQRERERLGAAARSTAVERFSLEAVATRKARILEKASKT